MRKLETSGKAINNWDQLKDCEMELLQSGALKRRHQDVPIEQDTDEIKFGKEAGGSYCLKAGTLKKIVERLTHPNLYSLEDIRAFIILYHDFETPLGLLGKFNDRFFNEDPTELELWGGVDREKTQAKVLDVMDTWLEDRPADFEDAASEQEEGNFCSRFYETIAQMLQVVSVDAMKHQNLIGFMVYFSKQHELDFPESLLSVTGSSGIPLPLSDQTCQDKGDLPPINERQLSPDCAQLNLVWSH